MKVNVMLWLLCHNADPVGDTPRLAEAEPIVKSRHFKVRL